MDKMREEFEAWWISKNPNHVDAGVYWHETGYWVNSNSAYSNLDFAWECWKASRTALCVELPSKINDDNDLFSYGFDSAISSAEVSLENAGVSYK